MWIPERFEADPDWVDEVLEFVGLAVLVTPTAAGLEITHLPWTYHPTVGSHGALYSHLAKLNPHWRAEPTGDSVVIVTGVDAYISPRWLPSTATNPRQVPTWDYEAIHLHGELIVHHEPEWIRAQVDELSRTFEASMPDPWTPADAPAHYIEGMARAIVGLELRIGRIEAKQKLSQNKSPEDVDGIVAALQAYGDLDAAGAIRRANAGKQWPPLRASAAHEN
ncbi:FMN-binding negative transcriptional regulator [Enemella sp. A6]|uniref:FMN-binding negative transcriptional regulator n=1 Tax=Enemella sp. A6 TaxID=3440152 RepID=UPI003EBE1D5C